MTKEETTTQDIKYRVLNAGAGSVKLISGDYDGWVKETLDINPNNKPDICMDVRNLLQMEDMKEKYDAVFCSHMLEHFPFREIQLVLLNLRHVLKKDGWLEILVPNVLEVIEYVANEKLDLDAVLYTVGNYDIRAIDVLYGLGNTSYRMDFSNEFMAHKYGFSPKSLIESLHKSGFNIVDDYSEKGRFELRMVAYP